MFCPRPPPTSSRPQDGLGFLVCGGPLHDLPSPTLLQWARWAGSAFQPLRCCPVLLAATHTAGPLGFLQAGLASPQTGLFLKPCCLELSAWDLLPGADSCSEAGLARKPHCPSGASVRPSLPSRQQLGCCSRNAGCVQHVAIPHSAGQAGGVGAVNPQAPTARMPGNSR